MAKVSTDKAKIEEILSRGVVEVIEAAHLRKRMLAGEKLRIKFGIDPTSPHIHLGHTVPLLKLRAFQELGHQAVLIIGDATAMIGDPSGRSEERQQLSKEEVAKNKKTYLEQAAKVLDMEKVEVHHNGEWFFPMSAKDFLELTSLVTVQQVLQREDFKKRVDDPDHPLSALEISYPIMQGYDSVQIKADVEIGGQDQLLNLLMGRRLQRKLGQSEQDVLTVELIEGTDGARKMSKSFGNAIALEDKPNEMFGRVMSITDELIVRYFELLTPMSLEQVSDIEKQLQKDTNPRDLKIQLAKIIVSQYYDESAAEKAEEHFVNTFSKKEIPDDIPELAPKKNNIVEVLVESGLCSSKSDVRRTIDGGGVRINDEKVEAYETEVKTGDVVQKGKRHFVKIK